MGRINPWLKAIETVADRFEREYRDALARPEVDFNKVEIRPSQLPARWDDMTQEQRAAVRDEVGRDRLLAILGKNGGR